MATLRVNKYSDFNGATLALASITQMANSAFREKFPGVKGIRADGYSMWVGYPADGTDGPLPVTRMISMKAFPTNHECNAKCLNGKHDGTCECQCGGKNHGRGLFTRILEAA